MTDQWKMAPLETTAEMNEVGCQAYMEADGSTWAMHPSSMEHAYKAMLAAAPVPPAGDVEVLAWVVSSEERKGYRASTTAYLQRPDWAYREDQSVYTIHELVDRAHVTRLTAERNNVRDLLKELARHPSMSFHQIALVEAIVSEVEKPATEALWQAQYELTRALGYLNEIQKQHRGKLGFLHGAIDDFLAQQSAPAAKDTKPCN